TKEEAEKLVILPETPAGNGVIRLYTARHCLLQAAKDDLRASREVSCGKCTFCREGLKQLEDFLKDTIAGRGKASQLDLMKEIAEAMDFSSMCSVGDRGGDLLLDSLEKFGEEFQAHLKKVCAANICFTNEKMYIDPVKCTGCGLCIGACPEDAIEGRPGYTHLIDRTRCTLCGKCVESCPENAIMKTSGSLPALPDRPVKISGSRVDVRETVPAETKRRRIRRPKSEPLTAAVETPERTEEAYETFDIQKYLQEVGDMKTYDTDICVVAGGPAGLAAAVQAAQEGAKVIVLEKSQAVGGAANMGMGPLGIGTKYQKQQMVDITVEKAFKMFMEYTHYQVDARLIKRYFNQSGETIEWLESMGVEFEGAYRYFPQSECTWHIVKSGQAIGPRAASFMNKALYNKALELGVEFLLETRGEHIVKENDEVTGVLAVTSSGENIRINCKAAIICTGGAGANPEMIYKETGYTYGKDMFNFAIPGITGDGLRMAWEAGVDHVPVRVEQAAMMVGVDNLPDSVSSIFFQPNLLVNAFGKRFMDETFMQNTTFLSNAVSNQKDRTSFSIVDDSIVREYIRNGVDVVSLVRSNPDVSDFYDGIKMAEDNQNVYPVVGNTIEELAEKLGLDPETLKETVDQYNNFCDTTDTEFYKDGRYLKPIYKAPFYACKIGPGGYGTVGGIRINENCEACDKDYYPVPGLYAAGADACNIYNDSYMFLLPGNSMGFAVNTGRIAGKEAAAYVKELAE
ncbi:MAG: FAD-dependent oxidoreductase, partial [Lachnospiraceae bacterium]|nr:FAD-dependent oxidoreductase [Lachnospiraceae bacterium]